MRLEDVLLWLRRHLWWVFPLVVLLINLVVLSSYRSIYSSRAGVLSAAIEEESSLLGKLEGQGEEVAKLTARAEAAEAGIESLYNENFATEEERFTDVVKEVRDLARRAGLSPDRTSYPQELFEDYGVIKRSMLFSVTGTYRELRLFVNYLELSDSFLVLESLGLQDTEEGLRIRVRLSTIFSGREDTGRSRSVDAETSQDVGIERDREPAEDLG